MIRTPGRNFNREQEVVQDLPNTRASTTIVNNGENALDETSISNAPFISSNNLGQSVDSAGFADSIRNAFIAPDSTASMISFNSSSDDGPDALQTCDVPGAKADVLYSLLSILGSHDRLQSAQKLLCMSQDKENCRLLRGSGCLSLLVQLLHPTDVMPPPDDLEIVRQASEALRNIVRYDDDEGRRNRDCVVLSLSERVRKYLLHLRSLAASAGQYDVKYCEPAFEAMATLVQLSYSEEQRRAMFSLGALHCIAEALILDEQIFSCNCPPMNVDFRRVIGMALTNLTYGAAEPKRVLCSNGNFLQAVNAQIRSQPEELKQIFACVLRNLSWKTTRESKDALKEAGTVETLMLSAMDVERETTLKSILSALWNLSYHCSENKARICAVPSALEFLVNTLAYKSTSGNVAVVESCGGILRNISSQIALKEDYRVVLRQHNCFKILLEHLESASLTIVSNACGTLWNLSAHNNDDQRALRQMGAEKKLRDLVHSKHKIISWGSAATLKNLLTHRSREDASSTMTQKMDSSLRPGGRMMEKGVTEDELLPHVQFSDRPVTADDGAFSTPRHPKSAAVEIANMLSDVTRPFSMKATSTPPFRIPAVPPVRDSDTKITGNEPQPVEPLAMSASYSSPSSKEEQLNMDKAAVMRFHTSMRRTQPLTILDNSSLQSPSSSRPFISSNYGNIPMSTYGNVPLSSDPTSMLQCGDPTFPGCSESRTARFVENQNVNRQMTDDKSKPIFDGVDHPDYNPDQHRYFKKHSGKGTPAEFKSEPSSRGSKSVTAITPLIFSRQSSLDSLDSCDQHSVRSTVYSEYSQQATGLPSPSELPDSPTGTLPLPKEKKKTQQGNYSLLEERKNVDGQSSAASAVVEASTMNVGPCRMKFQPSHDEKQSVKSVENENEEKPKVYGMETVETAQEGYTTSGDDLWKDQHSILEGTTKQEYQQSKLSASSSLSALTVDSDAKPQSVDRILGQDETLKKVLMQCGFQNCDAAFKQLKKRDQHQNQHQRQEQQHQHRHQQHQQPHQPHHQEQQHQQLHEELQQQQHQHQHQHQHQQHKTADRSCPELEACILAARPAPKTTEKGHRSTLPSSQIPASHPADHNGEADLRSVMHSAMPKPKHVHSKAMTRSGNTRVISPHRSGNVGIAKPILRSLSTNTTDHASLVDQNQQVPPPRQYHGMEPSNQTSSQTLDGASVKHQPTSEDHVDPQESKDLVDLQESKDLMEKSEELLQCIAMALPKPKSARKSKSSDRRSRQHNLSSAATAGNGKQRSQMIMDQSTASGTSCGSGTIENDQENVKSMFLSTSSALINSTATAERVKDASLLFDTVPNSTGIPVARVAPEPHLGTPRSRGDGLDTDADTTGPNVPQESTGTVRNDDNLSEDNYSPLGDSFSVKPEDVDIDSTVKSGEWMILAANESPLDDPTASAGTGPIEDQSPTELLIDCDPFTCTDAPGIAAARAKILKGTPQEKSLSMEVKIVRGAQRTGQYHSPPKVAVRTTKATELRAKKLQENGRMKCNLNLFELTPPGTARSRSMSPAMNIGVASWPARRSLEAANRTSDRLRHHSSCGQCPLVVAKEKQHSVHSKNAIGSRMKRKNEVLQKRQSGDAKL